MTRSFYSAAIFFTAVCFLLNCFLFVITSFQLGEQMIGMLMLTGLVIFQLLVLLIWSLIMLKYYHYKQYSFVFWVVVVSMAAYIFQFVLSQNFLTTYEISVYHDLSYYLALGMDTLYGISLIFSAAGKRRWLKIAGMLMSFAGLAMIVSYTWVMGSVDLRLNGTVEEIQHWVLLISSLSLGFFILNFYSEKETAEEATSRQPTLVNAMNSAAMIALMATLFVGAKAVHESKWISDHPNHVPKFLKEIVEPFEAKIYVSSQGDSLPYRWLEPLNYDSTLQYPLVISLHGSGDRGTDNAKQIAGTVFPQLLAKPENRKKYPAFIFVPQCRLNTWWGEDSGDGGVDSLLIECVSALEKEFAIDKNRRYLTGVLMGGYGTWHLISTRPEMFAAAIPMSGEGNPALAPNVVDVPVWAFHGARDGNVPVSGARDMIEAIKNVGGTPRYSEYPEEAHNLTEKIINTPELLDWLFAQVREQQHSTFKQK